MSTTPGKLIPLLSQPRIPGLDGLRALAVLLVIVYHFGFEQINGGFGVEIFFVLSGFLITWLLLAEDARTGTVSIGEFYRRRAARLLPGFYAYVILGLAYGAVRGEPAPWGAVVSSSLYVMNYYHGLVHPPDSFLSHCWSLAIEEQFYLFWPLAFRRLRRNPRALVCALGVTIVGVWIVRDVLYFGLHVSQSYIYRALETRADALAVGCLLAAATRQGYLLAFWERCARSWIVPVTLAVLAAISASLYTNPRYRFGIGYMIEPVLIAALIPQVILLAATPGSWARILELRPIVYLGTISYSLYLYQQITLGPAQHLTAGRPIALQLVFAIAVTVVAAAASYHLLEKPLRARIRRSPPRASAAERTGAANTVSGGT